MAIIINISAVYTCIKKPESFSHSGFSLKVARQLPLNTPKTRIEKPVDLRSMIFWNSAEISLVFCQCKRSLQSRRYYSGFWSRGTWPSAESPDHGPRRNAHYTCTVKGREKSRMRTTYQNTSMRFWVFRACAFRAKNPECYGFSGSVNGTDFGFCQCKWAYIHQFFAVLKLTDVHLVCTGLKANVWCCNFIDPNAFQSFSKKKEKTTPSYM